jgi:hypothetical protein
VKGQMKDVHGLFPVAVWLPDRDEQQNHGQQTQEDGFPHGHPGGPSQGEDPPPPTASTVVLRWARTPPAASRAVRRSPSSLICRVPSRLRGAAIWTRRRPSPSRRCSTPKTTPEPATRTSHDGVEVGSSRHE